MAGPRRLATWLHSRESVGAGALGFAFFAVTVGVEKLDPRNVAWITFKDQRAHWMGWLFFAADRWRWPLGANPRYGWGDTNSIVNTDSWPLFALVFKAVDLGVFDRGQYFGIALAVCSVALFVGSAKLFRLLGLARIGSLLASVLLATTPLFWWTQRWYPAISGGLCLLVWAFVLYVPTRRTARFRTAPWLVVLLLAIATNFYVFALIVPLWLAAVLAPGVLSRAHLGRIALTVGTTIVSCAATMYVLGYFTMPVRSGSTGRYGIYTANLLGLFDVNGSSRLLPDIPSPPLQYEPTSLGIATMVMLVAAVARLVLAPRRSAAAATPVVRRHAWLIVGIVAAFAFSVSNYLTIGERGYNFEIHYRLGQLFSVFQSSIRFIWPLTVAVTVCVVVVAARWRPVGAAILVSACLLQVFDVWPQMRTVAERADGTASPIRYEEELWSAVPDRYGVVAIDPPENIRTGWDECAYSAVSTRREARCAYLSRTVSLRALADRQESELLGGDADPSTIYWLSQGWVATNFDVLRERYGSGSRAFVLPAAGTVARDEFVYFFPRCEQFGGCAFLGDRGATLDEILPRLVVGRPVDEDPDEDGDA